MSSSGPSKKSGRSGGQSNSKKSAKAASTNNAKPRFNPGDQPEFAVEKITGKRFWNGRPQVRIKWQGYAADESTWEPMENIGNCMLLLADFEAKLFRRREHKKKLWKLPPQNRVKMVNKGTQVTSAVPVGGRVEIGKLSGPKANARPIGNFKKESPIESSESSDDEDQAEPSSAAVPQPSSDDEACDLEMISNDSSSGSSSPSNVSNGSSTEFAEHLLSLGSGWEPLTQQTSSNNKKKALKPTSTVTRSGTPEDPIDEALKELHMNPGITPISPIGSTPEARQLAEESPKVKNPGKKSSKKAKKQSQPVSNGPSGSKPKPSFHWKMPLRKAPFGLARGLELDKVVHNFKVGDKMFMFVHWKKCSALDAVPLHELSVAYPAKVIEYFESMERVFDD